MKKLYLTFSATLLMIIVVVSCNILKKQDNEVNVRAFLSAFQANLAKSDDEILKQFEPTQSKESILSAIRVLQNKESEYIECITDYANASIAGTEGFVTVKVHAVFQSKNVGENYTSEADLVLVLKPKDGSYVISSLQGVEFYNAFATLKTDMNWQVEGIEELKKRQPIYAIAASIQAKYDSVIWFTRYKNVNYFYVASGAWNWEKFGNGESSCLMGIVDEQGNIVVPVDYSFIGTIGISTPDMVEIVKDGKLGLFDIIRKQITIAPSYDIIIPYKKEGATAIVKQDSVYGWLDSNHEYAAGFPSAEAEQWVRSYGYIPSSMMINSTTQGLCEPPTETQLGRGCLMPPAYLVDAGIFPRVIDGISTTHTPVYGWTEYVQTKGTKFESITDNLSALITTVTQRYLEGREEFYTENRLVFVNEKNETLGASKFYTPTDVEITRVGDSLIQIKSYPEYWMEPEPADNGNLPNYAYFQITATGRIEQLRTERLLPPSKFVMLDSSYLSGDFFYYDEQTHQESKTSFLSVATITYFRDEILGEYGYIFPTEEERQRFQYRNFEPRYDNLEDVLAQMTPIDRHNVDFLERMISRLQGIPL